MNWIVIGNITIYAFIVVLVVDVIAYTFKKSGKINKRLYDKIQPYILILDLIFIIIFLIATKYKY